MEVQLYSFSAGEVCDTVNCKNCFSDFGANTKKKNFFVAINAADTVVGLFQVWVLVLDAHQSRLGGKKRCGRRYFLGVSWGLARPLWRKTVLLSQNDSKYFLAFPP